MDENNVNTNTNDATGESGSKQSLGSKLSSGISKANQLRQDYQNGGLTGVAKNAINNKIHDKIGSKVDAAKAKAKDKIDDKKDALKGKINDKLPDSVKQKKAQMDAKKKAIQDKVNAPKNKAAGVKNQLDNKRKKINETAFKKTAKTVADSVAPGSGLAAEKLLDSKIGKPAVEAARNASNPISAIKEGTKKLVEIIVKNKIKQKIAFSLIPILLCFFIVIVIVLAISSKFTDSQTYFKGDPYQEGTGSADISKLDKKYEKFYQYVEKYSLDYSADKAMIISVLTAYDDNDKYSDLDTESAAIDEESGTDTIPYDSNISKLSKSRMKKYIKKVAKKLKDTQNVVDEGDYENRETGSEFFWWLIDDFVGDYYADYVSKSDDSLEKKNEIVKFIYLYYNDIKEYSQGSGTIFASCPNGISVTGGDKPGVYDLEEYVAGVVASENAYSKNGVIEAMKAQAVAARTIALKTTSNCSKPIENSTNKQTFKPDRVNDLIKKAVEETSGEVLTLNGELIEAMYDRFKNDRCDGDFCYGTYTKVPSNVTHEVKVPISYLNGNLHTAAHGSGMSQIAANYMQDQGTKYDAILTYFYADGTTISRISAASVGDLYAFGGTGVMGESLFPISKSDRNKIYKSAGWYYPKGEFHGATDISCHYGDSRCHSIGIYSAHDGVVSRVTRDQCNSYGRFNAAKTGLKYDPNCQSGTSVQIKINSGKYKGYIFKYYHLSKALVNKGDAVTAGTLIGYMGNTGISSGPHLHFELRDTNDNPVDFNDSIDQLLSSTK